VRQVAAIRAVHGLVALGQALGAAVSGAARRQLQGEGRQKWQAGEAGQSRQNM
jgi:hypothetical protein